MTDSNVQELWMSFPVWCVVCHGSYFKRRRMRIRVGNMPPASDVRDTGICAECAAAKFERGQPRRARAIQGACNAVTR